MKRIASIICLCLAALTATAQKVQVITPKVNVGKTGFEVPVTATFELKATGSRHIHIEEVKPDCGCTKVEYPRKNISHGQTFTITMTYDARMLGHFHKKAAVYVKGSDEPVWLAMEGVVLAGLKDYSKLYPYAFGELLADIDNVEFDDVNKGDHPEVVINVLNNSEQPMMPNVLHLPPYLSAYATPETLEPGKSGKVILTLNSQNVHDFGLTQTAVYLAENLGVKVNSNIELPVSVVLLPNTTKFEGTNMQYAPKMRLSADSLILGNVGGKMRKNGTIVLTNEGRLPLKISSLQMFTQGMKVELGKQELQPGESAKLKVTVTDRNQLLKARQKPRVLMITNDPSRAKVAIAVHCQ